MSEPDDDFPADDTVEVLDVSALIDDHLEAQEGAEPNDFENEIPTVIEVRHVCPGCAGEQFRLDETDQPPASHAQAWRPGPLVNGKPTYKAGACRGTKIFYWCERSEEHGHVGTLTVINRPGEGGMHVLFFPDRRIEARPVAVERRAGFPRKDGAT